MTELAELGSAGAREAGAGAPPRALTLLDSVGLGINGIVGSGIYLLVAPLSARAGGASVLGVLVCGALCVLIALCFAELASGQDRSGGPYLYARAAFGPVVGFAVGWLGMATGVLGLAAVAMGFAGALQRFVPGAAAFRTPIAVALICLFGAINYRGVKAGGRTSALLSMVKVLPLVLLAAFGLVSLPRGAWTNLAALPPGVSLPRAITSSAFLAIFMLSGFEYATVPAGEVKNPRRTIPLAILASLGAATLLYGALQLVSCALLPDLARLQQPLPDLAVRLIGPAGGTVLGVTALLSMAGFCAGVALVAPRYFTTLAEDGYLPSALTGRSVHGTPGPALLVSTALASGLAVLLGYASLVDVANVVILSGYALTCLAALVQRIRNPYAPRSFRLAGGPLIPLLACASAVALLASARPQWQEWAFSGELLLLGLAAWGATALVRRRRRKAAL